MINTFLLIYFLFKRLDVSVKFTMFKCLSKFTLYDIRLNCFNFFRSLFFHIRPKYLSSASISADIFLPDMSGDRS